MKIAVLSGKGGAGKTFVSVNLAAVLKNAAYIDCDVEEPNGRLFFKPEGVTEQQVCTKLPVFDEEKCIGCRKCVDFCRFNALVYIKKKPIVFPDVCHSCGGCMGVCPKGAISEVDRPIGVVEQGVHKNTHVITGVLNYGESSGIPIIEEAIKEGKSYGCPMIIDCPPGSACSVMESVLESDYCVLVAEPTAFGFHNFCMVYELVTLLKKPLGVVINKMDEPYEPLEEFCKDNNVPVLLRIPYSQKLAGLCSDGQIASEEDEEVKEMFEKLLTSIGGAV